QRDQAEAVLAGVGCGQPERSERLDRLTLPAPREGLELVEEAASALRRAEIEVSELGLRRPTLDDVFLQLTGAPPSEDEAVGASSAGESSAPPDGAVGRPAGRRRPRRLPRPRRPSL